MATKSHPFYYKMRHYRFVYLFSQSSFLLFSDDGLPLEVEKFLRQSLKSFPHVHSVLLKQVVATLADIPLVCIDHTH